MCSVSYTFVGNGDGCVLVLLVTASMLVKVYVQIFWFGFT